MDLILGTEQNLILALYLVSIWSNIWFPGAIFIRHREDLLCQYFEDLADSSYKYKTTQIFKKCARRNIHLNSETLLTFFIGGGKRRRAVRMWVRVRDHCLRFFFNCNFVYLLASSVSFMGVLEIWEQIRIHFCFRSQWRKARKASFIRLSQCSTSLPWRAFEVHFS